MSNDDLQIVPERDEAISSRARPTKSSARDANTSRSDQSGSGGKGGLIFLLLLSFSASGYLYYLLQESNAAQADIGGRVANMEGKLSVTDESLSQSGAAMQAVLQDHDVQLESQMSEIRKLWGVSYDTNRTAIDELRANSSTIATNLSNAVDQIEELGGMTNRVDVLGSQVLIQAADLEDALTWLRLTRDELNQQASILDQIEAQSADNLDAIDSIDSFRIQMNQRFIQLEDEIRTLSTPAGP
jgi:hypothetical protein